MNLTILVFVLSNLLSADVFDRIDDCEANGGGSCVFDILRELASNSGGTPEKGRFCKCVVTTRSKSGGDCLSPSYAYYFYHKKRNKVIHHTSCVANDQNRAMNLCIDKVKKEPQCSFRN